ncbi:hypothetical protein B0A54_06476 [Friedmanniomyces endolithicus]|uniref:Uncharacterized protein n=1 Tax=Friedmanniomyces endolithicus TaxID=329885 RepID=A0A4U0UZB3_9PEZI|nr:hypothetical protein B0A54_06476 [Friedmanniomyces endolithicus]
MRRGPQDYTLPAQRQRDEAKGNKPVPTPMAKVRSDWQGESREVLLEKPDMLPAGVRELPRAHLVPPRPSSQAKSNQAFKAQASSGDGTKRKREAEGRLPPPSFPTTTPATLFPARPAYPRPPADPVQGRVMSFSWSWDTEQYTHTYASGAAVIVQPGHETAATVHTGQNTQSHQPAGRPMRRGGLRGGLASSHPRPEQTTMDPNPTPGRISPGQREAKRPRNIPTTQALAAVPLLVSTPQTTMELKHSGLAKLQLDEAEDDPNLEYQSD